MHKKTIALFGERDVITQHPLIDALESDYALKTILLSNIDLFKSLTEKQPIHVAVVVENHPKISGRNTVKEITTISPSTFCIILEDGTENLDYKEIAQLPSTVVIPKGSDTASITSVIGNSIKLQELSQSLQFAQKKYSQIFDNTKDGIVSISLDGHIKNFNRAFVNLTGYPAEDLKKKSFYDLTPKKWHAFENEILKNEVLKQGYADLYEKEYIQKDNTIIPIEVSAHLTTNDQGEPNGYWAFVRNISKRKQSEYTLQQQLKEVTVLQDLTSAGAQATNINELLRNTTQLLGKSLYPENFGILIYDEEKNTLRRHYSYHTNVEDDQLIEAEIDINSGIVGRAFRTGTSQRVPDVSKDTDYLEAYDTSRSEIAVPIFLNKRVFGVINSESPYPDRFTKDDEQLLNTMAHQISNSIARIQFQNAQNFRRKELSALYETAIATANITDSEPLYRKIYEHAADLLPFDTFSIVEYEPDEEIVSISFVMEDEKLLQDWMGARFRQGESGLIGWVIEQRTPYLAYDLQNEEPPVESQSTNPPARSWLGVPLISKGQVVGGLSVQAFKPRVFNKNHQRLLESLAALLAGVIASTHLIEHSKNQISRLQALHDIDLVINSSMDLQVTLNILLDQVIDKLAVDATVILLYNSKTNMLEYTASHGFRNDAIKQYAIEMNEGISGKTAMERHLVQALNLLDGTKFPYTQIMQDEQFKSYYSVPLIAKGQVKGVLDIFNRSLLNPDNAWFNFLETLAGQAAIAIDNTSLLEDLHQSNSALRLAYDKTLEGWSRALDLRDKETEGHTQRVVDMTLQIARAMGVAESALVHIRRGALLHDIGKMGIPDAILLKPGSLTDNEWEIMHQHPIYAYELLYPIEYLRPALDIPYAHHERWDGSGYPRQLKGTDIPLAARIFAVVDVWDALTSDRPYRPAWSAKKTIAYIQKQNGTFFDPQIIEIFLSLIKNELFSNPRQ